MEMPDPSGEEVALEIIDAAISSAFAVVHENELAASVLSFSVSTIISDLYRTVDWANQAARPWFIYGLDETRAGLSRMPWHASGLVWYE